VFLLRECEPKIVAEAELSNLTRELSIATNRRNVAYFRAYFPCEASPPVTTRAQDRYLPDAHRSAGLFNMVDMSKIRVEDKTVPTFTSHEGRRSTRVALRKGASIVVNLGSHPQRVPCLIVDRSPEGFRLRGGFRLRRGQVVEVIPGDDELNAIRCSVVWIGKPGSKQEGEVGLQAVPSSSPDRG